MPLVIKNNSVGLLALAIGAGAVSTTLQGGHTMPVLGAGDYCFATFVSASNTVEVVKVTAIVGNVITHAATTNAFDAGSRFELRPCKEAMDALMQEATAKAAVTLTGTDTYAGTAAPVPTSYVGIAWVLKFTNANTITTPSVNLNSLGAKTIKNRDGLAPAVGDIKAGSVHVAFYDGTNMILATLPSSAGIVLGQCRLSRASATSLQLSPQAGNLLTVNGVACTIPDGGVTAGIAAPAAPNTTYYIYAIATAGVITSLEASATAWAFSTTAGNKGTPIKSGDDTRTLVGMARGNGSTEWANTTARRFVLNYWQRRSLDLTAAFTTARIVSPAAFAEINTEIRNEFLTWADEAVVVAASGLYTATTAGASYQQGIGIDGTTLEDGAVGNNDAAAGQAGSIHPFAVGTHRTLAEGYHYATLLANHGGNSGTYNGAAAGSVRCAVRTVVRG